MLRVPPSVLRATI